MLRVSVLPQLCQLVLGPLGTECQAGGGGGRVGGGGGGGGGGGVIPPCVELQMHQEGPDPTGH